MRNITAYRGRNSAPNQECQRADASRSAAQKKTVVIKCYELFEVQRRIRLQNVATKWSRKIVVHKKRKSVERAVTWVSQDVHFIVSLNTAATSHRKPASAENRDHFEAVLLKKVRCIAE
jgi:hypothetical protein